MAFRSGNSRASKLTPMQVLDMREEYASGATQSALSRKYQMSIGQIGRIVRNESWQQFAGVTTDHDNRLENAIQQAALRAVDTPESLASLAKAEKLIKEQVIDKPDYTNIAPKKPPSLYDDKPPTWEEDQEAERRAQDILNRTKSTGTTLVKKTNDGLDELTKGD
jgi:hypothetical protein